MHTLHEAFVRERQRDTEQRSRDARLANQLVAERRFHRATLRRQRRSST